jgi:hypothetical protein
MCICMTEEDRQETVFKTEGDMAIEEAQTVLSAIDTDKQIDYIKIEYKYSWTSTEDKNTNTSETTERQSKSGVDEDTSVGDGAELYALASLHDLGSGATHEEIGEYAVNQLGYPNAKGTIKASVSRLDQKGLVKRDRRGQNNAHRCYITDYGEEELMDNKNKLES